MKKATGVFLCSVIWLGVFLGVTQAAEQFAYINLGKAFSEYNKTKDYDKILTDKENAYDAERDKRVNEVKQLQDKLNLLNDKEKEQRQGDYQAKVKSLQDFMRQREGDLRKDQDERMKEILKDIEEAVRKYSERQGYAFVFNDRVLVYQNKAYDITDRIVDILNKGYRK